MRMVFETADQCAKADEKFGAVEGLSQTLARLEKHLAEAAGPDFVIARLIDASRERVFKTWTDPRLLSRWWGPRGFTNSVKPEPKAGGAFRIVMRSPEGKEYPLKVSQKEVAPPERIVWTVDLSEHPREWHEAVAAHMRSGKGKEWRQKECVQTAAFEERDGRTLVTVRTRFESSELKDAMLELGMSEGWTQSLQRLAEFAASAGA